MTFKKKNDKVPTGYNLNFDKETKRWRLRIKREGKWETAGRFATEELAIAFANQSNRFKTQIAESKKPKADKETLPAEKEKLSSAVEEKKESPLEKVRKSNKKKPIADEVQVINSDNGMDETFVLPEKSVIEEIAYTTHEIVVDTVPPNFEFLRIQNRIEDLQHAIDQTNQAVTKAITGIEIQVDQLDRSNKSTIAVGKEFDRLRENLRSILNERVEPLATDVRNISTDLKKETDYLASAQQELMARTTSSLTRIATLELQASYIKTCLIVLGFTVAIIAVSAVVALGFLR